MNGSCAAPFRFRAISTIRTARRSPPSALMVSALKSNPSVQFSASERTPRCRGVSSFAVGRGATRLRTPAVREFRGRCTDDPARGFEYRCLTMMFYDYYADVPGQAQDEFVKRQ